MKTNNNPTNTTNAARDAGRKNHCPAIGVEIEMNCRAFTGEAKPAPHRLLVHSFTPSQGDVLVWNSIAGHFTSCHSLGGHLRGIARGIARRSIATA